MRRLLVAILLALALGLAGCAAAVEPPSPPAATAAGPSPTSSATASATAVATAFGEREVLTLLQQAVCWYADPTLASTCLPPADEALAAIRAMGSSGDARFVAPLIDVRWLELGWQRTADEALLALTGETLGSARAWYEWESLHAQQLPAGYAAWKGRLLSFIDAGYVDVLAGGAGEGLRPELLVWTGAAIGEVPALTSPATVHRSEQVYLAGTDRVFAVLLGDEARAYPERIVAWHGVVQDSVGGVPVVLTYCGLCGGASVFRPLVGGEAVELRTSGLAYDGRLLLVDTATGSLWDAFSGRAVWGPRAAEGASLPRLPLVTTTWADWSDDHPNTGVLSLDTGYVRDYVEGAASALGGTPAAPRFPLASTVDPRLPPETEVVGLVVGGRARAYPVAEVQASRVVHDAVGGESVVLLSYGPGTAVRVYRSDALRIAAFTSGLTATGSDGLDGSRWFVQETALVSQLDGREYPALARGVGSWLAWSRTYPDTSIWGQGN